MMDETVDKFSADATRFACADAGDTLEDANFSRETADNTIVSLVNEDDWITETYNANDLRTGSDSLNFMDRVLMNETNRAITETARCFSGMQFREGIQKGWYEMLLARNEYRSFCNDSGMPMHKDVVTKWCEALVIMICPVCPHWSEKLWKQLGKKGYAVRAPWPVAGEEDKLLTRQAKFLRDNIKSMRQQAGKQKKAFEKSSILVIDSYPQWKVDVLLMMQETYNKNNGFPQDFMKHLKGWCANLSDKKLIKNTMQFASFTKNEVEEVGPVAMETTIPFDQRAIMEDSIDYLKSQLNLQSIDIINLDNSDAEIPDRLRENVVPGKAYLWFH
jgi:leucyl-tRNA synthetase